MESFFRKPLLHESMRYGHRIWHKVCFHNPWENVQKPLMLWQRKMDLKDTTKRDGQPHQPTSAEDITQAMIQHVVG
ncbi:MAG: hypothetical protein AMJ65_11515, partial [Phycisphaerae bacterium SG8_4]